MTHSAEDLVQYILSKHYGVVPDMLHSDVRHGFIIGFPEKPDTDLQVLEDKVYCIGKRIHVKSSSEIENFRLVKQYVFDPLSRQYLLVGIVGREEIDGFDESAFMRNGA